MEHRDFFSASDLSQGLTRRFPMLFRAMRDSVSAGRLAWLLALSLTAGAVFAAEDLVLRGKNDWLFVRFEAPLQAASADARLSLQLISQLNRVLASNQIALAVVVVPSKIETHAEHLPADFKISPYMAGFNQQVQSTLKANGVQVIDLKGALRKAAVDDPNTPVFHRLDSHWTHTGALVAANTVLAGIQASPALKQPLDQVLAEKYLLSWSAEAKPQLDNDIVRLLPAGSITSAPDAVRRFTVTRAASRITGLLGDPTDANITLVGSSFSDDVTGFPGALRYVLQRDMLNFSIKGDLGPWMMMKAYLTNEAFQSRRPRLVIWEIPERAISWPPSYPHREARYITADQEWLRQSSALVLQRCDPAAIIPSLIPTGMLAGVAARAGTSTTENDFIELGFEPPAGVGSYLSARITAAGSRTIVLEASGAAAPTRRFSLDVAGDNLEETLKVPLGMGSPGDKGINRLKIYPGKTTAFSLADIEVCRYPDYLLSP